MIIGVSSMECSYIIEFKCSDAVESFYCKSRDKGFVLDFKLLFTIVDRFLGRFMLKFVFTMKLVYFIGFPRSSYLVLFTILVHWIQWDVGIWQFLDIWQHPTRSSAQDTRPKPNPFYSVFGLSFFYLLKVDKRTISRKPKA